MTIKEFAQKNGVLFFSLTIVLLVISIVLGFSNYSKNGHNCPDNKFPPVENENKMMRKNNNQPTTPPTENQVQNTTSAPTDTAVPSATSSN